MHEVAGLASWALLIFARLVAGAHVGGEEQLIGWRGETFKPKSLTEEPNEDVFLARNTGNTSRRQWIQTISWTPRAFVYHNFLSPEEAAHIIRLAAPQMKRSTVVGANNSGVVDNIRTSAGTFIMRNADPIINAMEQRLAVWSQLPPSHQEDTQVLRYGPTNKYGPHCDGLGRVMSVLIYLVAPEEGGETAFPQSKGQWLHDEVRDAQGKFSACAEGHVAYKPKVGDALMFYDKKVSYLSEDMASMHTGCPVVKGVKWNAVKWIHGIPFRGDEYERRLQKRPTPVQDPGICTDYHSQCKQWAEQGECQKNPTYMLGSNDGQGACRKACEACQVCKSKKDLACVQANRAAAGYINFEPEEFGPLKDLVMQELEQEDS